MSCGCTGLDLAEVWTRYSVPVLLSISGTTFSSILSKGLSQFLERIIYFAQKFRFPAVLIWYNSKSKGPTADVIYANKNLGEDTPYITLVYLMIKPKTRFDHEVSTDKQVLRDLSSGCVECQRWTYSSVFIWNSRALLKQIFCFVLGLIPQKDLRTHELDSWSLHPKKSNEAGEGSR